MTHIRSGWDALPEWVDLERWLNPYYGMSDNNISLVKSVVNKMKNLSDKNNISYSKDTLFGDFRKQLSDIYPSLKVENFKELNDELDKIE
jgi:hypothetical protein